MRKCFLFIVSMCFVLSGWVHTVAGNDSEPSVVVRFSSGKAVLNATERVKLRRMFQTYNVSGAGRVFVLGFADNQGAKDHNYKLSRERAQAVQHEIVSSFGIDATVVMAMGKGSENPVADNGQAKGRALNRRVEIYLANAVVRHPERVYGSTDPYRVTIQTLVKEADALVRERRFEQALIKLQQAHAIGGDHYSDWHTVMGISGFYAGATPVKVNAHLATAVQLDPYNFKAREFLSRMDARHKVATGKITSLMGQSPEDAIPVTALVQAHEYLQLFGVEPVAHHAVANQPVEVWACLDKQGRSVVYHFNYAPVYRWVYAQGSVPQGQAVQQGHLELEKRAGHAGHSVLIDGPEGTPLVSDSTPQIWESRIFK
jgi:hypothetical protein